MTRPQGDDRVALDADARQQRLQRKLRMPRRGSDVLAVMAGDQPPAVLVEMGVQSRQYHRAVRKPRNSGDQICGCRDRPGRAGDNHRPVRFPGKARCLGFDQRIASRRRLDSLRFAQNLRPAFARDLQEAQRELPKRVELVRYQFVQPLPRHVAGCHVFHQPGEVVRQSRSRRRRLRHQRRSGAVDFRRLRPSHHQPCQQKLAFEPAQRRRQGQRIRRHAPGRALGERDLVLVDVADRDNARQDRAVAAKPIEKRVAHQPAGAARRQIKRRQGKRQRIIGEMKAETSVVEGVDQRRQKRDRRWDVENARSHLGIAELAAAV